MVIVEDLNTLTRFTQSFRASAFPLIIPVFADAHFHPRVNRLCLLYVECAGEGFILPYCHNEARNLPGDTLTTLSTSNAVITPFKKILSHVGDFGADVMDLAGIQALRGKDPIDPTKYQPRTMKQMLSTFRKQRNVISAVPMMILVEWLEAYAAALLESFETPLPLGFYGLNDTTIPAITFMEQSGVKVNTQELVKHYGERALNQVHDGFVYCDYNPYNTTFRVTNKFGVINFSAMNKTDGSRKAIVSRFDQGALVHMDFEAFHVRMIGQLINFDLPSGSLHEYFGRQYFGKETLTPEEYQASKTRTMELLYGQDKQDSEIPYFCEVQKFIDTLWTKAQAVGYIESSFSDKRIYLNRIENAYPAKLFNYLLQLTESEITMRVLNELRDVLRNKQTKVTLYTYDSLMFDFAFTDGKELIWTIVNVLEQGGTYPVRVHVGPNYHELTDVTQRVRAGKL